MGPAAPSLVRGVGRTFVLGLRISFCLILPVAIVPTEWYLLDLGKSPGSNLVGMLWVLAMYALLPIGFVGGLFTLVWQLARGISTFRVPSVLGVLWSVLALSPALLLVGCKWLDVDEYGFLDRHEGELLEFVESPRENELGYELFWQDEDVVVVGVHFVLQLRQVTGFAYCRSAADAVRTSGGEWGAGAAESAAALERIRAAWVGYSCTGSHLRGPWSMVAVLP